MEITKKRDGSMKKIIKEKLIKKAYNYIVWLKRKHKKIKNQVSSNFEEFECEKSLNTNQ